MTNKTILFDDWLEQQLEDPELRDAVEDREIAYQITRLRMTKGITQTQLADIVGTKQSSIARLESGKTMPRLSFLRKIINALGGRLDLEILSEEEIREEQEYLSDSVYQNALIIQDLPSNHSDASDFPTVENLAIPATLFERVFA